MEQDLRKVIKDTILINGLIKTCEYNEKYLGCGRWMCNHPKWNNNQGMVVKDTCIQCNIFIERYRMIKPLIICLCGSTRFKDAFEKVERDETLKGKIVLTVGFYGHLIEGLDMENKNLHLRKIDLADEIMVLNVDGYIDISTAREIEYARSKNKPIYYLEETQI